MGWFSNEAEISVVEESRDLDSERVDRAYKDLQSTKYYLGFIGLTFFVGLIVFVRAFFCLVGLSPNTADSAEVDLLKFLVVLGIFLELAWVVKFGQVDRLETFKHKQFSFDVGLASYSLLMFFIGFYMVTTKVVRFLEISWVLPLLVRAALLTRRTFDIVQNDTSAQDSVTSRMPNARTMALPVAKSMITGKISSII